MTLHANRILPTGGSRQTATSTTTKKRAPSATTARSKPNALMTLSHSTTGTACGARRHPTNAVKKPPATNGAAHCAEFVATKCGGKPAKAETVAAAGRNAKHARIYAASNGDAGNVNSKRNRYDDRTESHFSMSRVQRALPVRCDVTARASLPPAGHPLV